MNWLTKIKIPSMARRINYKINKLVKEFGYNSPVAQDMMADILTTVPASNIVFKKGVPQIRKPINLAKQEIDLTALDKAKGYGQIKKEYEKTYEVYKYEMEFSQNEPMSFKQFIRKSMDISTIIDKVKSVSGSGAVNEGENLAINIMKKPIKTYEDLFKVGDLLGVV